MNTSAYSSQAALPGFITLYNGMPVVLRMRNLSTELGIANGSQGYVRHIETMTCSLGFTYATSVLVEFPTSKVQLPGLPKGYFPIQPVTWTFVANLASDNSCQPVKITRHQLPIQPGFAVTGHSAQGKTLPKTLTNMREGGFAAYVSASRAQKREGLCLIHPVSIEHLNKPLPYDLVREVERLEALEHNTYIHFGFQQGILKEIPDPESEITSIGKVPPKVTFSTASPQVLGKQKSSAKSAPSDIIEGSPSPKKDS